MARAYDGELRFGTSIDSSGFNRGTRNMERGINVLTGSLKKFGGALAGLFAVKQLFDVGREAIAMASDLQEVQNVVDTAFGDMAYMAEEFAKISIENFGMSKLSAKQYASTYMAMGKGMGLASQNAADMAIETTKRIGDVASFYNMAFSEVDTMMKSIWTGETESLKRIGVVMTETNLQAFALSKGIKKNITAMTQAEKTQLRYAFVMEQTALAAGDFAKTSESWANQTRILSERWKEFLSIMGTGLIQAIAPVIKGLNALMAKLIEFGNLFSKVTARLFGKQTKFSMGENINTKGIEDAAGAQTDLAKATKAANKELKNNTAAFDELNVLSQDVAKGAGKGGAGDIDMLSGFNSAEIKENSEKVEEEMTAFEKNLEKLLKPLKEINLEPVQNSFKRLSEVLAPFNKEVGKGLYWFYMNVLVPLSKWYIENVLPKYLDILAVSLEVVGGVISKFIKPIAHVLFEVLLKPLAEWQGNNFVDDLNFTIGVLEIFAGLLDGNFKRALAGAMQALEALGSKIRRVFVFFLGEEAVKAVENFAQKTGALIAVWWNSQVAPWFTKEAWLLLLNNVKMSFAETWEQVKANSSTVYVAVTTLWGKASGFFKKSVIDPTKNAFKDGINFMIGLAEGFVNRFIDGINKIIDAINSISFDIPKTLGGGHIGFSLARVAPVSIPRLATGAVIPPNGEFMAMLGDQKHGKNLEAPEELIRQIVKEETASSEITINFGGSMSQLVRLLKPHIEKENVRKGKCLVKGAPA